MFQISRQRKESSATMTEKRESFIISKEDWSLHRKGYDDQKRHLEKVQEAIRKNLPDLITEENIILSNGQDVVKIPIRSLDEFKIRYNFEKNKHIGQGTGDSKVGDVIAREQILKGAQNGKDSGSGAGDHAGEDFYETNVSLLEIEDELFSELELPYMKQKELTNENKQHYEFNDIRRTGLMGNIDKKRTMLSAFKRNAIKGEPKFHPIQREDLKFKTWNDVKKPASHAVIIAMIDMSGSMGAWEKYMSRSFFFWMTRFLRRKYERVELEFIAHHTQAKVVAEEEFFTKGENGGTICSSAYSKAIEIIKEKYPVNQYNIYAFHFSDGDNLSSDIPKCVKLIEELLTYTNMFGYGEVNQYSRNSTLMNMFKNFKQQNFKYFILKKKSDVFHAMKHFFKKEIEN
jgi:sporulation protein YhbH